MFNGEHLSHFVRSLDLTLSYNGGQKNLRLCERNSSVDSAPKGNFFVRLWVHPVVPPLPLAMLWPKKALIFTHFAPNPTLFGVGVEGSLVLVISLERSQHF